METSNHPVSPLRQRMLEDMHMRKLAPKTQQSYIRAVSRFAKYLGRSPDTATAEDLRRYQLHLVDAGTSPITLNATITGLKFLFDVTLGHGDVLAKMAVGQQDDLEHDAGAIGTGSDFLVVELGIQDTEVEFMIDQIVQCKGKAAGDILFTEHYGQ